ncbi:MAG TPA: PQQ-dependent sugar dehydrogenase [Polyangiaceae bacterium]|nr:PQQ-dependent sugar dehydrogenase [Polyangiaceae bacterium]
MILRHLHSRARFVQAIAFTSACLGAVAVGPGCSGKDVELVGTGGAGAQPSVPDEPNAIGGSSDEDPSPPDMPAVDEPGPPPDMNEGTGGAPPLDPPGAVSPGTGGTLPTMPPPDETPPSDPPPSDPPSDPPPSDPPPNPVPEDPPPGDPKVINCQPPAGSLPGLKLTPLVSGLNEPTFVTAAPGDDTRLYVLEKSGAIRIVENGQLLPEPFLNLTEFVDTFNEQGLVGLAFHPNYAENGRFFVQYAYLDPARQPNDLHEIILSEFSRSAESPNRAVLESEQVLMVVEQPSDIHLAGMLAFGPTDGMLYISRGDGGTSESQDLDSPLGKLLRIDVDEPSAGRPYGVPEGNLNDVVWNYGLRNPWRFSFDACIGDIYIGDVGEASFEEINFAPAGVNGQNYGWKVAEGPQCYSEEPPAPACDTSGFTPAIVSYERDFGCAVTGGYVYRGSRIPALRGTYIYADYCFGNFGALRIENGRAVDVREITDDINPPTKVQLITSFGVDNGGEMYVVTQTGELYRIDPR